MSSDSCAEIPEALPRHANQSLPSAARALLWAHVSNCPHCRGELVRCKLKASLNQHPLPPEHLTDQIGRAIESQLKVPQPFHAA